MAIPKRVADRFRSSLKRLVPILQQQRDRDISEADTVTLVKDVLSETLGYDKYTEVTGEYAIRGTFCDLAIKVEEKMRQLIEVKAIGIPLDDRHLRQAINYAANEGVEWVMLTNAIHWRLYNVIFAKPIDKRLVLEVDLTGLNLSDAGNLERLYALSKEGYERGAHVAMRDRQDALSRFVLSALLLNNKRVGNTLRRELRRVAEVNVKRSEIVEVLRREVIKRDTLEDPQSAEAAARVRKAQGESILGRRPRKRGGGAKQRSQSDVTIAQLIDAGLLTASVCLFRSYKGQLLEATVASDGSIEYAGKRYDNPSAAAVEARATIIGERKGTNGWAFWRLKDNDGNRLQLADLRNQYESASTRAAVEPPLPADEGAPG